MQYSSGRDATSHKALESNINQKMDIAIDLLVYSRSPNPAQPDSHKQENNFMNHLSRWGLSNHSGMNQVHSLIQIIQTLRRQ